jgi:addiction module RelB/DinJ family antitoxin
MKEAKAVFADLGITSSAAVSMFFAQVVKLRALPFQPSAFPVLEEYGVTLAEADAAEARLRKEIAVERKAGRLVKFTGKLK